MEANNIAGILSDIFSTLETWVVALMPVAKAHPEATVVLFLLIYFNRRKLLRYVMRLMRFAVFHF